LASLTETAPAVLAQAPAVNAGKPSTLEDFKAGDESRERYQRATELLRTLDVKPGTWVADVGAGAGYYAMRLSDMVGPTGKVFAEDISDASLRWLNRRVTVFGLQNVAIVRGAIDDPNLPANQLDAVLVMDSYHHFAQPQAMLEHILQALKPGSRLVIADYSRADHRGASRAEQLQMHEIDPAIVRSEIDRLGFRVVRTDDTFLKQIPEAKDRR